MSESEAGGYKDFKEDACCRCCAFFCVDQSCVQSCDPCILISGKLLCLAVRVHSDCSSCGCILIRCDKECWSTEQGLVELRQKVLCTYSEVQCPPSTDIGCGCCGMICCGGGSRAESPDQVE